jgi:hypothetical protein
MSEDLLYRVVFNGNLTGEYDLDTTKRRVQKLFRLTDRTVSRMFAGKEVILKDNVAEDVAMNYAIKLADAGCECYIDLVPADDDISTEEGFVERRRGGRRMGVRRPPRPGAIVPDRREVVGRRRSDRSSQTA